jgi:hypothetical protein
MDGIRAELIEWQARCADLSNSLERMREERDAARASVDLLWGDLVKLEDLYQMMKESTRQALAENGYLKIKLQEGIEL